MENDNGADADSNPGQSEMTEGEISVSETGESPQSEDPHQHELGFMIPPSPHSTVLLDDADPNSIRIPDLSEYILISSVDPEESVEDLVETVGTLPVGDYIPKSGSEEPLFSEGQFGGNVDQDNGNAVSMPEVERPESSNEQVSNDSEKMEISQEQSMEIEEDSKNSGMTRNLVLRMSYLLKLLHDHVCTYSSTLNFLYSKKKLYL